MSPSDSNLLPWDQAITKLISLGVRVIHDFRKVESCMDQLNDALNKYVNSMVDMLMVIVICIDEWWVDSFVRCKSGIL